ncbi:MAG: hypothetical protein ABH952_06330 [Candidatus Omnitrophota bacterium]
MKTKILFKIIAIILINAFLCMDISWAAGGSLKGLHNHLAPAVETDTPEVQELFKLYTQGRMPEQLITDVSSPREGDIATEAASYKRFMKFWEREYKETKKRNYAHALINGLVYAGEICEGDIKIRIYPDIEPKKGLIGVLVLEYEVRLSLRYTDKGEIEKYNLPIDGNFGGREYDWRWIEGRFTLERIKQIITAKYVLAKVGELRDIYEGYLRELDISDEEEKLLRSNLAIATFYCVRANTTPYETIKIYLKALGMQKEGLDFRLKKQLVIATYEVAMNGHDESLKKVIQYYKRVLGDIIPEELKQQWIIATYAVAMNVHDESLRNVLSHVKETDIFNTISFSAKGDLLIITSYWALISYSANSIDVFIQKLKGAEETVQQDILKKEKTRFITQLPEETLHR